MTEPKPKKRGWQTQPIWDSMTSRYQQRSILKQAVNAMLRLKEKRDAYPFHYLWGNDPYYAVNLNSLAWLTLMEMGFPYPKSVEVEAVQLAMTFLEPLGLVTLQPTAHLPETQKKEYWVAVPQYDLFDKADEIIARH